MSEINENSVDRGAKHANIATGVNNPDGEYNVYGSKLEDIREINRLKDENLELKLIIGEQSLELFKLKQHYIDIAKKAEK